MAAPIWNASKNVLGQPFRNPIFKQEGVEKEKKRKGEEKNKKRRKGEEKNKKRRKGEEKNKKRRKGEENRNTLTVEPAPKAISATGFWFPLGAAGT